MGTGREGFGGVQYGGPVASVCDKPPGVWPCFSLKKSVPRVRFRERYKFVKEKYAVGNNAAGGGLRGDRRHCLSASGMDKCDYEHPACGKKAGSASK